MIRSISSAKPQMPRSASVIQNREKPKGTNLADERDTYLMKVGDLNRIKDRYTETKQSS